MKKTDKNNENFQPLLKEAKDVVGIDSEAMDNNSGMGSEKWHTMLYIIGPHLTGQGKVKGFLTVRESFKIKTLTKETLGEANLKNWRGLHSDSKENCYTIRYLGAPWGCVYGDLSRSSNPPACCIAFCCIICCPPTCIASLLGCLGGAGRDIYNFSKKGVVHPLDDSKGIKLGLFTKHSVPSDHESQQIQNNKSQFKGPLRIEMS